MGDRQGGAAENAALPQVRTHALTSELGESERAESTISAALEARQNEAYEYSAALLREDIARGSRTARASECRADRELGHWLHRVHLRELTFCVCLLECSC